MKPYIVCLLVLATTSSSARADVRSLTQTYEYGTLPSGVTEIELWQTQARRTWQSSTPQSFEQIVEIEHGITDKFTLAFYTVFTQVSASQPDVAQPLAFDNARVTGKYRFGSRGTTPFDFELYVELYRYFGRSAYELEVKSIFSRDFDDLNVTANTIAATEVGRDVPETEVELQWTLGSTYALDPKLRVGAETWGGWIEEQLSVSAGPAIGYAPSGGYWIAFTAGFGIANADAFSGRAIIGLHL